MVSIGKKPHVYVCGTQIDAMYVYVLGLTMYRILHVFIYVHIHVFIHAWVKPKAGVRST